jgi:BTB/POZ domain
MMAPNPAHNEEKPIFIDRDGHLFSYVLNYMRDNGRVHLPVTLSKEALLSELEYFGFDKTNINVDCITSTITTFNAILQVDKMHKAFNDSLADLELEKDYAILAYFCFCGALATASLQCNIKFTHEALEFPTFMKHRIGDPRTSSTTLHTTLYTLYYEFSANRVNGSTINDSGAKTRQFNSYLAVYGFKCNSILRKKFYKSFLESIE